MVHLSNCFYLVLFKHRAKVTWLLSTPTQTKENMGSIKRIRQITQTREAGQWIVDFFSQEDWAKNQPDIFFVVCFESSLSFRGLVWWWVGGKTRFTRCGAFNKGADKRITYTKEVREKLQAFGRGVVKVPPVVGRHSWWTVLRGSVVQEVGQQLSCQPRAVQTLVEKSSKHWIRQQGLIYKERKRGGFN